jgi:hypothetical protein
VLHQAEQRGQGRHQGTARLLLGQPVEAAVELSPVLIEERFELDPSRLINGVLEGHCGERRHDQSISAPAPASQPAPAGVGR